MRYVKATNTGKGFITHVDQETMGFSGKLNNVWAVGGIDEDIDDWIVRVSGTELTEVEAAAEVGLVSKFMYGRMEHLVELLTRAELNGLMDLSLTVPALRTVLKHFMDNDGIDARLQWYNDDLDDMVQAGILTTTRRTVLLAGK